MHEYVWDHLATEATVYYETDEGNVTYLWKAYIDSANRINNAKFPFLGPIESNSLVLYSELLYALIWS